MAQAPPIPNDGGLVWSEERLRTWCRSVGVTDDQLADRETFAFIKSFVLKEGGITTIGFEDDTAVNRTENTRHSSRRSRRPRSSYHSHEQTQRLRMSLMEEQISGMSSPNQRDILMSPMGRSVRQKSRVTQNQVAFLSPPFEIDQLRDLNQRRGPRRSPRQQQTSEIQRGNPNTDKQGRIRVRSQRQTTAAETRQMSQIKNDLESKTQLLSKMKDEVTCCICLDVWKNPKTLPCDHTMCNDCLAQMQSLSSESSQAVAMISIRCPECRCDHVIEADQWHSSWKTSRQLIVLAKSLTEMKI